MSDFKDKKKIKKITVISPIAWDYDYADIDFLDKICIYGPKMSNELLYVEKENHNCDMEIFDISDYPGLDDYAFGELI